MADISVNWRTRVIFVPKAYTQLITSPPPQEIRQLDTNQFRLDLKALEATANEGMPFVDTHRHNTTVTVGGVILARVIEIINGYTVEFEDGQYAVNLVGSNNNIADVSIVNQVSIRPSNSAGLQDLSSLQAASYQGVIVIDTVKGEAGTLFPIGTGASPSNNEPDALLISAERGILDFLLHSDLTLTEDFEDFTITGASALNAHTLTLGGVSIDKTLIQNVIVTGAVGAGSSTHFNNTVVSNVTNFAGRILNSGINSLSVGDNSVAVLLSCYDTLAGLGGAQITMGTNSTTLVHSHNGDVTLLNMTAGCVVELSLAGGNLILDASCTGGDVVQRGVGNITRNDGNAVTVHDAGFISDPDGKLRRQLQLAKEADGVYREIE